MWGMSLCLVADNRPNKSSANNFTVHMGGKLLA